MTSSTQKMQCGLPTLTTEGEWSSGASMRADLQLDVAGVAECLGQRNFLPAEPRAPHVDGDEAIAGAGCSEAGRPAVSMVTAGRPVSPNRRSAMQREALPQLSTSSPALFQMRMRTSAAAEGSSTISWSQPMPVLRSAMARALPSIDRQRRARGHRARRNRCRARSSCGNVWRGCRHGPRLIW